MNIRCRRRSAHLRSCCVSGGPSHPKCHTNGAGPSIADPCAPQEAPPAPNVDSLSANSDSHAGDAKVFDRDSVGAQIGVEGLGGVVEIVDANFPPCIERPGPCAVEWLADEEFVEYLVVEGGNVLCCGVWAGWHRKRRLRYDGGGIRGSSGLGVRKCRYGAGLAGCRKWGAGTVRGGPVRTGTSTRSALTMVTRSALITGIEVTNPWSPVTTIAGTSQSRLSTSQTDASPASTPVIVGSTTGSGAVVGGGNVTTAMSAGLIAGSDRVVVTVGTTSVEGAIRLSRISASSSGTDATSSTSTGGRNGPEPDVMSPSIETATDHDTSLCNPSGLNSILVSATLPTGKVSVR